MGACRVRKNLKIEKKVDINLTFSKESRLNRLSKTSNIRRKEKMEENSFQQNFFAQSVRIKLGWAQAAKLSIFLIGLYVVLHLCEGPDYRHTTDRIEKRRKMPSTRQDSNPRHLCHEACALPLSYNLL